MTNCKPTPLKSDRQLELHKKESGGNTPLKFNRLTGKILIYMVLAGAKRRRTRQGPPTSPTTMIRYRVNETKPELPDPASQQKLQRRRRISLAGSGSCS